MKIISIIFFYLLVVLTPALAQKRLVVAHDGSGDFKTVQAAINAVPDSSKQTTVIFIKKGVYKEKLTLPASKQHITMIGEDRDGTILTYDDFASKPDANGKNPGTSGSSSFFIYGDDFSAANLTFENSSGPVGQAVAVRVTGTRIYFQNCRFLGFQDTLYTHGDHSLELYRDCYIEGTVDFIFGAATAWFENCTIHGKREGGYLTAASTIESVRYGYVFNNCHITGETPEHAVFLGRPWRPNAKTVFLHCDLGNRINAAGWQAWSNKDNLSATYYAEYGSRNTGDTSRPDWTHQLTKAEAFAYTERNVLGDWMPAIIRSAGL